MSKWNKVSKTGRTYAVDPVDEHVGEEEEPRGGEDKVRQAVLVNVVVETRIAAHFAEEQRDSEHGHPRNGLAGHLELQCDLVRQELGMLHEALVEQEDIRQQGERQVHKVPGDCGDGIKGDELSHPPARHSGG